MTDQHINPDGSWLILNWLSLRLSEATRLGFLYLTGDGVPRDASKGCWAQVPFDGWCFNGGRGSMASMVSWCMVWLVSGWLSLWSVPPVDELVSQGWWLIGGFSRWFGRVFTHTGADLESQYLMVNRWLMNDGTSQSQLWAMNQGSASILLVPAGYVHIYQVAAGYDHMRVYPSLCWLYLAIASDHHLPRPLSFEVDPYLLLPFFSLWPLIIINHHHCCV